MGENLAPYVSHVHIHDNCGDRDSHIGLGSGNLPWQEVLGYLPETKERTWTIECMQKEDIKDALTAWLKNKLWNSTIDKLLYIVRRIWKL